MIEVIDHKTLRMLTIVPLDPGILWLAEIIDNKYGTVYITSAARPGDSGVHGTDPCRGLDIRSRVYQSPEDVVAWINNNTVYDYTRPTIKVAILHDTGQGMHIHLQVHPNIQVSFPR